MATLAPMKRAALAWRDLVATILLSVLVCARPASAATTAPNNYKPGSPAAPEFVTKSLTSPDHFVRQPLSYPVREFYFFFFLVFVKLTSS
jgi:hypothetical protein